MTLQPTLATAVLAGLVAGIAMPILWPRLEAGGSLVIVFLAVVVLPAHAFVVGFQRPPPAPGGGVDRALLRRVVAWLLSAALAAVITGIVVR